LLDELVEEHGAKGTLHRGTGPYVPPPVPAGDLHFPGKAIVSPAGFLVSSSAGHQLVELEPDGVSVVRRIGSGRPGRADGAADDAKAADLSSPWDLAWYDDRLIVAMAGIHQLWWFDPVKRTVGGYAGTTVEALRDGPLADAWLAQPSGLSARGERLWVVDSESSALRFVADGAIHTAAGQGLFDFGYVDGPATEALFQHPLGVLALPDGAVLVADTYNGAVRRYADGAVST